jgi:hypothetical protein
LIFYSWLTQAYTNIQIFQLTCWASSSCHNAIVFDVGNLGQGQDHILEGTFGIHNNVLDALVLLPSPSIFIFQRLIAFSGQGCSCNTTWRLHLLQLIAPSTNQISLKFLLQCWFLQGIGRPNIHAQMYHLVHIVEEGFLSFISPHTSCIGPPKSHPQIESMEFCQCSRSSQNHVSNLAWCNHIQQTYSCQFEFIRHMQTIAKRSIA